MKRFIAYYRVSTRKQGDSGLGLEAQKASVRSFLGCDDLVAEFEEVESGATSERPALEHALRACRMHRAVLVIAKLDRLSRSVSFISRLMDEGVEFVAVDMPTANRLTVHILAAMAEFEREAISSRTKAALAAAKARGVRLGGVRPGSSIADHSSAGRRRSAVNRLAASQRARQVRLAWVRQFQQQGITTLRALAGALNAASIPAMRGGSWTGAQVKRLIDHG